MDGICTLLMRSVMAVFSEIARILLSSTGPAKAAVELNNNIRPWMAPTYLVPNKSASYAGRIA